MPYRFGRGESVSEAGRRVIVERLAKAADGLRGGDPVGTAVHQARRSLKEARAALKLVRGGLPREASRHQRRRLRDAGRQLAPVRDARVLVDTLDRLGAHRERTTGLDGFVAVRKVLRADVVKAQRAFRQAALRERVASALDDARGSAEALPIEACDWGLLARELERCYLAGVEARERALRTSEDDDVHAWRKRAKELWCFERLLRGIWPGVMRARAKACGELSDLLGQDHDLAVLRATLTERPARFGETGDVHELVRLSQLRSRRLRADAVRVAERVYAESAKAYAGRMGAYLRAWSRQGHPR